MTVTTTSGMLTPSIRRRACVLFAALGVAGAAACAGSPAEGDDPSSSSASVSVRASEPGTSEPGTSEPGAQAAELDDVTLVLDWTPNTNHSGIYLAEASGWYDEEGIDLTVIQPGANGGLQALASGDAEFAVSVQEELTPARAAGLPVVSIAAIIEHNTSSLMSLEGAGIARPADMQGTRYGGWGGQLESAIIDALVKCDGGDPSTVDLVSVGDADYRVGLQRDDYDVVWVFDGWDKIRFELDDIAVNTIEFGDYQQCVPDWYTPLLATSEHLVGDDAELVQRFVSVTARGYRAAMADPGAAADALLRAAPELDEELVRASAEFLATRYTSDPSAWGRQDPQVWDKFTDFLDTADMLSGAVDPSAAFTNTFIDAANNDDAR